MTLKEDGATTGGRFVPDGYDYKRPIKRKNPEWKEAAPTKQPPKPNLQR